MTAGTDILVNKAALRETRIAPAKTAIGAGEALLHLTRFALTSNNVTYAAIGDQFGYWKFFPAEAPYGRVPVWGYADVVESLCAELPAGERVWGYFPMASHLVVTPAKVTARGFIDGAPHRAGLPPIYNQYERVSANPAYSADKEAVAALFQPLFGTSFLLDDFLAENAFFGAKRVMLSSASSKTALGLAKLLHDRGGVEVVGLTSAANADFVKRTGYFHHTVTYDGLKELPADTPALLVDMAGDTAVIDALADRLGAAFVYNCMVGGTHWDARSLEAKGPPRTLFFAPDRGVQRTKDWGAADFAARRDAAWRGFEDSALSWLKVVEKRGEDAVLTTWLALLDGKTRPEEGYVLSL